MSRRRLGVVTVVAELAPDSVAEGVYAVARKQRLRTKSGARVPRARARRRERAHRRARVERRRAPRRRASPRGTRSASSAGWSASATGSSSRCARSSRRPSARSGEPDPGDEAATRTSWTASSSSSPRRSPIAGLRASSTRFVGGRRAARAAARAAGDPVDGHHAYAGGLLEHTVGVATLCRETAQLHPRLRADLLLAAALLHDLGRTVELGRPPLFRPTQEGALLGHVHLGLRLVEERAADARRRRCAPSSCTRSARTTTRARPARRRRRCSTTRTSSTRSPPLVL